MPNRLQAARSQRCVRKSVLSIYLSAISSQSFVKRKATDAVAKELRLQAGMKPKYVEESSSSQSGADELRDLTHVTDSFKKQIGLL